MKCKDCPEDGPSVQDQWETFEDIPLCDACADERWRVRVSMGIRMPREWENENYDPPDYGHQYPEPFRDD